MQFQTAHPPPVPRPPQRAANGAEDTATARLALETVWSELAPIVGEARELDAEVARNPRLLNDPWASTHTRWLHVFEQEIDAVQTVYSTTRSGARLSVEEIRKARDAAYELLRIIKTGRELVKPEQDAQSPSRPPTVPSESTEIPTAGGSADTAPSAK
jgi:hypothetical protein